MKNYIFKREFKPVDEKILDKMACNKCGKEVLLDDEIDPVKKNGEIQRMHSFTHKFEYGSKFEGQNWSFEVCEDCLTDLVEGFAIPPEGYGYEDKHFDYYQEPFEKSIEPEIEKD